MHNESLKLELKIKDEIILVLKDTIESQRLRIILEERLNGSLKQRIESLEFTAEEAFAVILEKDKTNTSRKDIKKNYARYKAEQLAKKPREVSDFDRYLDRV